MKIYGNIEERNFDSELEPLFQAMLSGKSISSITIMAGRLNKDDRSKDIVLQDVVADSYWQGMATRYDKEKRDYISLDYVDATLCSFYMSWIISYTL